MSSFHGMIQDKIKGLEERHNISILFAVENGSRAWKMESSDSDYDVRFVFTRSVDNYIGINPKSEVIEEGYNEKGEVVTHSKFIDIVGFDIRKFAKLLLCSNPSMIEWLVSDIVYYGEQNHVFKEWALKHFKRATLLAHYKSLAKNNYLKYIDSKKDLSSKRYLYCMRGILNSLYVREFGIVPPIHLEQVVVELSIQGVLSKELVSKISEIVRAKKEKKEREQITNIAEFDLFIERFINEVHEFGSEQKTLVSGVNAEVIRLITRG